MPYAHAFPNAKPTAFAAWCWSQDPGKNKPFLSAQHGAPDVNVVFTFYVIGPHGETIVINKSSGTVLTGPQIPDAEGFVSR